MLTKEVNLSYQSSVFGLPGHPSGKKNVHWLAQKEMQYVHVHVLINYAEVKPYLGGTKIDKRYNIVEIRIDRRYKEYDPFIISHIVRQVYYVPYPSIVPLVEGHLVDSSILLEENNVDEENDEFGSKGNIGSNDENDMDEEHEEFE
ncbi:hypothetical protein KIW84_065814 [Lathyrus oleraceus]|uniref:DUF4216 domain-containing protein n=1 Tax=Pisum sativum TaxID=3888 RepID=A0A9D4WE16_PEA|nr:hypothetical protein KIW84_065814 [Pisum sativum]